MANWWQAGTLGDVPKNQDNPDPVPILPLNPRLQGTLFLSLGDSPPSGRAPMDLLLRSSRLRRATSLDACFQDLRWG